MRSDARLGAALFSIGAVSLYVYRSRFTGSQAVVSEDRPDDGADDGKELQDLDPPPVDEQREEDFKKEEPTSFRDLPPPSWGTGELVRLFDSSGRRPFLTVLVERRSGGGGPNGVGVSLAMPCAPYARLRLAAEGGAETVDWGGKGDGKSSLWCVESPEGPTTRLRNGFRKRGVFYLRQSAPGTVGVCCVPHPVQGQQRGQQHGRDTGLETVWVARAVPALAPCGPLLHSQSAARKPPRCAPLQGQLSAEQKRFFVREGYLVLPGLLPEEQVHMCRTAVHARLGRPGGFTHFFESEEQSGGGGGVGEAGVAARTPYRRLPSGHAEVLLAADPSALGGGVGDAAGVGRLARNASQDPTLLGAARHPSVMRAIMAIMGQGKVAAVDGCQVALRFPGCNDALVLSGSAVKDTVTGSDWHTDGLRQGKMHSFSVLVGIALSGMEVGNKGNLCVWPKSHRDIHKLMRWPDGKTRRANGGFSDKDGPLPDLGPPTQLLLRPGDVVLAHSTLGHSGGPHLGSGIRSMLYFRVRHSEYREFIRAEAFKTDMWCDLEGLHDTVKQMEREVR